MIEKQKRLIILSVIVSFILMIIKFVAFFITGSNAIFTDAAESIVNVIASGFAFYSIHLSSRPRDHNHPYGHGKVEFFSVFVEGGLILLAGTVILIKAFYNLIYPQPISHLDEGMWLIIVTAVVNYALGIYLVKNSRSLNSMVLEADGKHLKVDAYSTCALVIGLLVLKFTQLVWIDSAISICMGLLIAWNGYKLFRKAISGLMDESDTAILNKVVSVLNTHRRDQWIDIHNLRVQRYGNQLHIDCHLTLPNYFDLNQVHDELVALEALLNEQLETEVELFVHADPCVPNCCAHCAVNNCPIRTENQKERIEWTTENITKNMKHYQSIKEDDE